MRAIRHVCCNLTFDTDPAEYPHALLPADASGWWRTDEAGGGADGDTNGGADSVSRSLGACVRLGLGSFAALPPLLLFAPSVAAALQNTLKFERPPSLPPSVSAQVDHTE